MRIDPVPGAVGAPPLGRVSSDTDVRGTKSLSSTDDTRTSETPSQKEDLEYPEILEIRNQARPRTQKKPGITTTVRLQSRMLGLLPQGVRTFVRIAWDVSAWILACTVFLTVRFDGYLSPTNWEAIALFLAGATTMQIIISLLFRVFSGWSKVGSFREVVFTGITVCVIVVVLDVPMLLCVPQFPSSAGLVIPPFTLMIMLAGRSVWRGTADWAKKGGANAKLALVWGAGEIGHEVVRLTQRMTDSPYLVVGLIDDNVKKRFLNVEGRRVLGTREDLSTVVTRTGAEILILAVGDAGQDLIHDARVACERTGLDLVVFPPMRDLTAAKVTLTQLRRVRVEDILGRRPVNTDVDSVAGYIKDQVVLVTGAGGSIGSELSRQIAKFGPFSLLLLDHDESLLHAAALSLPRSVAAGGYQSVLCDIRDQEAVEKMFNRYKPNLVFHAAALKHLPMLERFPAEGWKTNVLGTRNVLEAARKVGVSRVVNISTDKAADPVSVLGRSKRTAERFTAWYAAEFQKDYVSVRFGNVLGSRGSVLDTFRAQIDGGGPVTVTDPEVTRFFMTIPEACELVLQAGAIGRKGAVLVLDMGEPVKILDVAEHMISESGRSVEIEFTGLRTNEKLHEVLLSESEEGETSEHPLIRSVRVPPLDPADALQSAFEHEPTEDHHGEFSAVSATE